MIVKLYSTLRLDYAKGHGYDADGGVEVSVPGPVCVNRLCEMIGVDASKVSFASVNGRMLRDFDKSLEPGVSEIGLHPQAPAGG